jgi:hypothetical protein
MYEILGIDDDTDDFILIFSSPKLNWKPTTAPIRKKNSKNYNKFVFM